MKYFVIPDTKDGCDMPTWSESIELTDIGAHIAEWIKRYRVQGYYSNCNHKRLILDEMSFRLVPDYQTGKPILDALLGASESLA